MCTHEKMALLRHWLQCKPTNVKKIPLHLDNAIWHHEFEKMKKNTRADILVTHEAPSCHRHGKNAIEELAEAIGAKKIFMGIITIIIKTQSTALL